MSLILLTDAADPFTARDIAGRVLPLATLDFFVAGTSEPADVGDDDGHFEADDDGIFEQIELEPDVSYRVVHKTADGVLVYDVDPYVCTCGEADPVFRSPIQRAFGADGAISPGAKLYSFEEDGETPQDLYADAELERPLPNPIVANAAGAFPSPIYADDDLVYTLELRDAGGALLEEFAPYECACGVPAPVTYPFDITVQNAGDLFIGYSSGEFLPAYGSITPDPALVAGVELDHVTRAQGNFQIRFVGGATMPASITTITVETSSGDVVLDAQNPDSIGSSNRYRWAVTPWAAGDNGVVRTVTFQ